MTSYHKAAYTLDPVTEIPEDAAPAIGVEQARTADEIAELSAEAVEATLTWEDAGGEVTFTITPEDEPTVPFEVEWDFGNGRRETGHDLVQRCWYAPGSYQARATVRRPGQTTWDLWTTVIVGGSEPEPEPPPGA
jgi:hypothetical protein